jgi:hypothetical protein
MELELAKTTTEIITKRGRGRPKKVVEPKPPKTPKVKKTEDRKTYMRTYMNNYMKNLDESRKKDYVKYQHSYRYKGLTEYNVESHRQQLLSKIESMTKLLDIINK